MRGKLLHSAQTGPITDSRYRRGVAVAGIATLVLLSPPAGTPDCMGEAPIAAEETDHGFAAQRARAEAYEAEGNWVQALMIWIAAAGETIPAHASGARSSAGVLVERLREAPAQMAGGQFEELEPVLRRGVEIGIDSASMLLGEELRRRGRPEDAFEVFQESASNGYAPAMIQIGLMYSNGDGTRKDLEKASSWLRPANVKGDAAGKYLLAECFLFGKGVGKNEVLAVTLLEESVEMGGPARALDLLGTCNHKAWGKPQNSMEAARLYGLACDRGFYNACANLSVLTMRGDGVEQDPERAIALIKKGADAGNPLCMFFYGASFLDGLGVPQDHDVAAQWMKKAAALENANAKRWCREQGLTWEEESSNSH